MQQLLTLLRQKPDLTDRWGFHLRPIHYYEPLPDFRRIDAAQLSRPRSSPALDFRMERQCALLRRLGAAFGEEIATLADTAPPAGFDFSNPYFAGLDAAAYYALIRDLCPRLVLEIGSGYSTQIAAKALARNALTGKPGRLVCIEPYPEARLADSAADFELVERRVQDLPLEFFDQLTAGDILMIDSSHVATTGSDVCYEFLDILPRLASGVWVHVHDIFLPADYPAEWVLERRLAWNEQYMLEAFLAFNESFTIQLANAWLWRREQETARSLFPYSPALGPASFWMTRE